MTALTPAIVHLPNLIYQESDMNVLAIQGLSLIVQAAPEVAKLLNSEAVTAAQLNADNDAERQVHQGLLDAIAAAKTSASTAS